MEKEITDSEKRNERTDQDNERGKVDRKEEK